MRNKRLSLIVCPNCKTEYLPAEIYVPYAFFGKPQYIEKDYEGKILDYSGKSLDTYESYICDNCNKPFKVFANISFTTAVDNKLDFSEDYKTAIRKDLLELEEE